MLLIIFLGLIDKISSVSNYCDIGPLPSNDFDWTKVGIRVLTCLL